MRCLVVAGLIFMAFAQGGFAQDEAIRGKLLFPKTRELFFGVDPGTGDFLVCTPEEYYVMNPLDTLPWRAHPYKRKVVNPELKFFNDFRYVPDSSRCLFLVNGGGEVYEFRDSSLLRIDRSFRHKNQFGGAFFAHRKKIYIYGGYGFFTHKDYMTEFALSNPEWFLYPYHERSAMPAARSNCHYQFVPDAGRLYIAEGRQNTRPAVLRQENKFHRDVWEFTMNTHRWRKLGFVPPKNMIGKTDWPFFAEGYTYVVPSNQSRQILRLDIAGNELAAFESRDNLNQRIFFEYPPVYSPRTGHFLVIMRWTSGSDLGELVVQALSRKDLEGNLLSSRRYYQPFPEIRLLAILGFAGLTGTFFFYRYWRRPRRRPLQPVRVGKLILEGEKDARRMLFEGRLIPFEPEHWRLIEQLLAQGGRMSNQELLDFVRSGPETQEALKKRKTRLVQELNHCFEFATRLPRPFLEEQKDPSDLRYKEYVIGKEYLEEMGRFSS